MVIYLTKLYESAGKISNLEGVSQVLTQKAKEELKHFPNIRNRGATRFFKEAEEAKDS